MDIVKVTTSGQISIPKKLRSKIKADYFTCVIKEGGYFFKPVETDNAKFTIEDLKKWNFKGKNSEEKDLSRRVDELVYLL